MSTRTGIASLIFFLILIPSVFAMDWGYSGTRRVTLEDHLPHPLDSSNYLEQWTLYVRFDDASSLVFQLSQAAPSSEGNRSGISLILKRNDGSVKEERQSCELESMSRPFLLQCGDATISGSPAELKFRYTDSNTKLALILNSQTDPFRPRAGRLMATENTNDFFDVMLTIPRAQAVGKIDGKSVKGLGNFLHTYTNVPPQKISRHWIQANLNDDQVSIFFGVNVLKNNVAAAWFNISGNSGISYSTSDLHITLGDLVKDPERKGYFYPRTINMNSTEDDGFKVKISNLKLVGKPETISEIAAKEGNTARRGPAVRYTLEGNAVIDWPMGGQLMTTRKTLLVQVRQFGE